MSAINTIETIVLAAGLVCFGNIIYGAVENYYLRRSGRRVTVIKNGKFAFTLTTNSKELTNQTIANLIVDGYLVKK